jgi:dolichol-phosphate mannosyltransferase
MEKNMNVHAQDIADTRLGEARPADRMSTGTSGFDRASETALSVVVPVFNESENIHALHRKLASVLGDMPWEVIFVDDASPDGTGNVVRELARRDRRVRLIERHDRRGLSSAVVEGALAASADVVAVMDGDLQHDEGVLPKLYQEIASGRADIASASRFLREDGADGLSSVARLKMSNRGIRLANSAFDLDLTDPLTGFFAIRRETVLDALPHLSGRGFKILLDIITATPVPPRVVELPFRFRPRLHGESKLDRRVMYDFFLFFIEKKIRPVLPLPARFISFALINGVGILVHLATLVAMVGLIGTEFTLAQFMGTLSGMAFNFTVNNAVTYSDQMLRGRRFVVGFALFCVLCSVGVIANVGMANILHERYTEVSYVLPALAGALIAVVWNYAATRTFVWGRRNRQSRRALKRQAARQTPGSGS